MASQTQPAQTTVFVGETVPSEDVGPPPRDEISSHHLVDEMRLVGGLTERAIYTEDERRRTAAIARRLVENSRGAAGRSADGIDAFMREYDLTTEEGVILLCLAEALLRIPDTETADAFLADKLASGNWRSHLGQADSVFVNASTWGLLLSGRVMKLKQRVGDDPLASLSRLVARSGEGVVRRAVRKAVELLSDQFVMGRDIDGAIARAKAYQNKGYRISFDMLGEEAVSSRDAATYFDRYMTAVESIGEDAGPFTMSFADALMERPSLSVKLSALHSKFTPGNEDQLTAELVPRVLDIARAGRAFGLPITLDAEEQDRLDPTLQVFASVFADPELAHWNGLGIAVQAYSKRAIPVLRWLRKLAQAEGKRIPVRLVKGAYWDNEIKWAQEQGLADYPVFTRKLHTDVSYLAAMRFLFADASAFFPQIATHNAHSIAAAMTAAGHADFEYQRLHGMGEAMYNSVLGNDGLGRACRVYAPVGEHEVLLSYLVRRLLENGANTSFVNRLADREAPLSDVVMDPVARLEQERESQTPVKMLVRPRDVFWPDRKNSTGVSFADPKTRADLHAALEAAIEHEFEVGPIVSGKTCLDTGTRTRWMHCPHNRGERLGSVCSAKSDDIAASLKAASKAAQDWDRFGATERAKILQLASDIFERDRTQLMAVIVREAGKTVPAAQRELRQAIDYLRFYAAEARELCAEPLALRSTTGETNRTRFHGRGVFAAIAPWSSPLAVFTGQVAAALAAGNAVVAKSAPQTPLTAFLAVSLLHEAGVPEDALHLLTGDERIGALLCEDHRVTGVAVTGRTSTAWAIQKTLVNRRDTFVPFIASTSTLNAMISDSSALGEQLVRDTIMSAFSNAGQTCSAARVLFVQDDTADRFVDMLVGATRDLVIGDPMALTTDIGPVIDNPSQDRLDAHKLTMKHTGTELVDCALPTELRLGSFVSPAIYEITDMSGLKKEVFGPILHIVRYQRGSLDRVVDQLNATGFGGSVSVHSRIDGVAKYVEDHARVGNVYVNCQQVDAVPGVQPYGGVGLSGMGAHAGGPNYLRQFTQEAIRTDNITATGGNVRLLAHDLKEPDQL